MFLISLFIPHLHPSSSYHKTLCRPSQICGLYRRPPQRRPETSPPRTLSNTPTRSRSPILRLTARPRRGGVIMDKINTNRLITTDHDRLGKSFFLTTRFFGKHICWCVGVDFRSAPQLFQALLLNDAHYTTFFTRVWTLFSPVSTIQCPIEAHIGSNVSHRNGGCMGLHL